MGAAALFDDVKRVFPTLADSSAEESSFATDASASLTPRTVSSAEGPQAMAIDDLCPEEEAEASSASASDLSPICSKGRIIST